MIIQLTLQYPVSQLQITTVKIIMRAFLKVVAMTISRIKAKKTLYILGDSMVKDLKGWEMANKLNNKHKIIVRSFSSAKTSCMHDYVKPTLREHSPDHIILHVGTNDLNSKSTPDEIARSIIDLAVSIKTDDTKVSISTIIPRNDKLNNKPNQVNKHLKNMCKEIKFDLIDHSSTIRPHLHLNGSRLHLNKSGTSILGKTFVGFCRKKNFN